MYTKKIDAETKMLEEGEKKAILSPLQKHLCREKEYERR